MSEWSQKRFWTDASAESVPGGFTVHLDGRAIKTPNKSDFVVPTLALAQAVAAEWAAQGEKINPLSMPCTRSANSSIDKVAPQRDEVIALLADYGRTDLLCYRAEGPEDLVNLQAKSWDPMLKWAANHFGAQLNVGAGVMYIAQNEADCQRLAAPLFQATNFEIAALHDLIGLTGSLVLGLAAARNDHDADMLWDLSRIDETWQQEQWGKDEEAAESAEIKRQDFKNAHSFYRLVHS